MAVAIKASEIPGATTDRLATPVAPMPWKEFIIPQTVPKRPTKGAVAPVVAKKYVAKTVINMSNIDRVYDKDPRVHSDAKPINEISWKNFEKLVGDKWIPGLNMPFDPIATKLAKEINLKVIILNGKNIINLGYAIANKKFTGTVIS